MHDSVIACNRILVRCTELWSDIPRGSVLGPILFSLCINDLPNSEILGLGVLLFADDTKILVWKMSTSRGHKQILTMVRQLHVLNVNH